MTKILQYCSFLRLLKTFPERSLSELTIFRHISISRKCQSADNDFFGIENYVERKTRDKKHNFYKQNKDQRDHYDYNSDFPDHYSNSEGNSKYYSERKQSRPKSGSEVNQRKRQRKSEVGFKKTGQNYFDSGRNESTRQGSDFIDDQYFNVQNRSKVKNEDARGVSSHELKKNQTTRRQDLEFIDKQYFGNSDKENNTYNQHDNATNLDKNIRNKHHDRQDMDYIDDQFFGQQNKQQTDSKNEVKPKSTSAYEAAREIRRNLKIPIMNLDAKDTGNKEEEEIGKVKSKFDGPVDSKGFRILKYQTQDLSKEPEGIVVDILKKNVIYNEGDIIAINKPYGLPSHGGPGVKFSVGGLLHQLAQSLYPDNSLQTLHLIHRLDKETTGVMLLAKRASTAEELREYFVKRKVIKKYWLITKGIPEPLEGVIKIPITEGSLSDGIHRMILKPEYNKKYSEVMKKRNIDEAQDAITHYKVFKQHNSAALVECKPISGVKHQIRCHLGFGLNTPILGDHKYSHFSKLAPQRLPPDMLTLLGIRQSKVRHVPMHLHAKSIVIPEFKDGQNLMISAKLPKHFLINLRRLKLN